MTNRNKIYAIEEAIKDLYELLDIARYSGDADGTEARIEGNIELLKGELRAAQEVA